MGLPTVRLVAGTPPTAWSRPLLPAATAAVDGITQVHLVLERDGEWLEASSDTLPGPDAREWHTVDADLRKAAGQLTDVRDESGILVEIQGPVAPALTSEGFCKAALQRLGAIEALAVSPDGVQLRLRDAWQQPRTAQLEALARDRLPGSTAIWLVDKTGVKAAVLGDRRIDCWGDEHFFGDAPESSPTELREQVIFARALLAFLGGLVLAGGLLGLLRLL